MHETLELLLASGPVVTDGAWGTQFQQRGLPIGASPDIWNLSHPELVEEVAQVYVDAGSQIILTNTFRANSVALADSEGGDQIEALNKAGAEISLRAAKGKASVFGSIGPCGKMLCTGEVEAAQLLDVFSEQANALAAAGVDGLVIETMSDLAEALVALEAAKKCGLPVVACTVYDSGKDLDRTMMGNTAEQVAKELTAAGADVIGANCGQGIESYINVCRQLKAATDLPVWIKANAGVPIMEGDTVVYNTTAEQFADRGPALYEAGASFLGGCCGTGPDFIKALCARVTQT